MTTPFPPRRAALLLLAAIAAWLPALACGFVWDDDDYVTQNPVLRTAAGIARIWFEPTSLPQYYPLVHSTFWLEYRIWGPWAPGYHAVNVALHAASALLLWRLLLQLAVPGALFGALLFAVHPVHVESVAWVTERKNVLSMVCYLLAARSWLGWQQGRGQRHWWLATAWFLGALLSKTVTASLPAALLVLMWWRHGRVDARMVRGAVPWLVLGAALGWFTVHLESTHVGASGTPWQPAGAERVLVAGRALWFYLGSLAWPFGLCFNYPRWTLDPGSVWQWAFPVAAVAALAVAWLAWRRIGRGPLAALLLYGGTLVPALGFFDVFPFRYSFVADHFQYHASIAMLALLAAAATGAAPRLVGDAAARWAAAAIVALLAVLTFRQCGIYRDLETLWTNTLACNPESTLALTNLGGLALDRGELATAKERFERGLALDPANHEAVANLGVIAHKSGDRALARRLYEQALELKRDLKEAMSNLAVLHLEENRPEQAWSQVAVAIAIDPDFYAGRVMACRTLVALRHWQDAVEHAEWVLARTPDAHDTRLDVADCLLALGQVSTAAGNAAYVLQRRPDHARASTAMAKALARLVAAGDAAGAGQRAVQGCRNGKVDPARLLPLVAEELRALGAMAHAADVASQKPGG
jgi:tetratricopeptide (TPR) repeat protein